ncbi:hypothetical protein G6F64_014204 [Rhizopus arrhizus]|uniref:Uncharacterized protein n=1 Tax=Rhizopus oryzae TaxID=64495 RepID=A0A9P6WU99_RHIOR|nr:hypothetical protein G6F64_014204 [Rhizopus arrhizus]
MLLRRLDGVVQRQDRKLLMFRASEDRVDALAQLLADAEHQAAAQADPQPRPAPRRPPQQGEEVQAKPGVARAGVPGRETRLRRHAGRAQGEQSDEGLVAAIAQQIPWAFHRSAQRRVRSRPLRQ